MAAHEHFHFQRRINLAQAGPDGVQHMVKAGVCDGLRAADGVQLLFGFDGAERIDGIGQKPGRIYHHARQHITHAVCIGHGGLIFHKKVFYAVRRQNIPHLLQGLFFQDHLGVPNGSLGDLDIARIDDKIGFLRQDQHRACIAGIKV